MTAAKAMGEKQWWGIALLLGFFAFALYANTIPNGYALDDELVTRNHRLTSQGIKAIPEIFSSYYYDNQVGNYYEYRPVVLTSFAIEHTFFDDNAHVSHAINALLYGLACLVLFFVVRSFKPEVNWLFPALVTILFAAHPIHTEVVASIKNRDEIFSFLFGISALFWALKYARQGTAKEYVLFLLLMLLSVMSKRSVLSYAIIIPLAACWLSQANLLRLLTLSFPLMLLVLFFSPIYEEHYNAMLIAAIIGFPIVAWSIRTLMEQGTKGISQPVSSAFKSLLTASEAPANPTATKQGKVSGNDWLSLAALVFLTVGALIAQYLDLRVVMVICLIFLLLSTFALKPHLKSYPLLLLLLVLGITAVNFGFTILLLIVLGLLLINIFKGTLPVPQKMVAIALALMVMAFYVVVNGPKEVIIANCVLIILVLLLHYILINISPKLRLVMPAILLVLVPWHVFNDPGNNVALVIDSIGAVFLAFHHRIKKFLVLYTAASAAVLAAIFVLVVFPFQPENPMYENNLGAYYANLPDPYGDGEKTVADVVPTAGRAVDFVENPLAAEKDFSVRLATASKVMGYYTYLFVAPVQLRYYYGYNQIPVADFSSPVAWLCLLSYLALLVLAFWLYKRDALLSFSLLYLLFGLLFISNIGVLITGIVAERLAFGTSLGFCMLLAWGAIRLFKLPTQGQVQLKGLKPAFLVATVLVVGLYATRTIIRNTNWKSKETLYTHDAKISPKSAKTQQLLGNYYVSQGIVDEVNRAKYFAQAEKYLKNAIAIAPKFHNALFDLGHMYSLKEDCQNAVVYFERFMAVSVPPPQALFSYALCLDMLGRYKEAVAYYERFILSDPYFATGYSNLSYLHFRYGNIEKSLEAAQRAIEMIPNDPDNYINAGAVYLETNRAAQAIPFFEKAHSLKPNDLKTVLQLWDLHSQVGDPAREEYFYNKAVQLGHKF